MLSPIRRDPPGSPSLTPLNPGIDPIPIPTLQRDAARARANLAPRCLYIKPSGERCGSPAMNGLDLCYYHDRYQPKPGYRNLPCLEDPHSVQCAIQEIIEDMLNGLLDYKKAALALYGLQTAASNLKQMRIAEEKAHSVQRSACSEEAACSVPGGQCPEKEACTVDRGPCTAEESFGGARLQPCRKTTQGTAVLAAEVRVSRDAESMHLSSEGAASIAAAQSSATSREATNGFSPARSAGAASPRDEQSRRDGWNVSREDELEEIELVAASDTNRASSASTASSCVHSSLPTTNDQRPPTFIESPRQPQHVTFGLTSAERERMKEVFPDMKKIREEFLSMLTPEERAEIETLHAPVS